MLPATPAARLRGLRTGPSSTSTVITASRDQSNAVLNSLPTVLSLPGPTVYSFTKSIEAAIPGLAHGSARGSGERASLASQPCCQPDSGVAVPGCLTLRQIRCDD